MVLVGGYSSQIHVYILEESQLKFKFSLLGHFNSIKALAVSSSLSGQVKYLASASQDQNIRIWKICPLENPD